MIAPTSFFADYGCHVRILEEVRALQRRGHAVRVCAYHNGDDVTGVKIRRTVDIPWRKRPMVGSSRHKMYLDLMLFGTTLREALRFRPTVIHAHLHEGALIGAVVGRLLRVPVVFDYQGSLTEEMLDHHFIRSGGLREFVFRRLERLIDRLPDVIVPSSKAAESWLLEHGQERGHVKLLADAIDPVHMDPCRCTPGEEVRTRLGIPLEAPVVVYLGLLAPYQGTPVLIEATRLLLERRPNLYVVIAGYPDVERHVQLASDIPRSGQVLFPGRVPYADAPGLLAIAAAAAAPKQSSTEGNGKVLNYMAMRLPTVAVDTPSNRALLGDLGIYVPPADPVALAAGLERALDAPAELRRQLRERAVEHFSWRSQVRLLESIYVWVQHQRAAPGPVRKDVRANRAPWPGQDAPDVLSHRKSSYPETEPVPPTQSGELVSLPGEGRTRGASD
jgi:glycosyltransferase involved in cell wall biosynthesis